MLSKIINYFWPPNLHEGQKLVELKPSKKFLNGFAYLSILKNNGIGYCPPIDHIITKIEYISLEKNGHPHYFEISYGHHILFDNFLFGDLEIEKDLNINSYLHHHIIIKLKDTKIKLPIQMIPNFKIILTLEKSPVRSAASRKNFFLKSFVFKEITPVIEEKLLENRKNIGLCFSGGGPRSFVASIGYLRSLVKNNYLKNVKYISAISGSTWALVPFTYLDKNVSENVFLGLDIFGNTNKKLDLEMINYTNGLYLADCIISRAANWKLIKYVYESFKYLPYGDRSRIWPFILGKIFLEPFKLFDSENFFTFSEKLLDIFRSEPLNVCGNHKFRLTSGGRPFLISSANIVKPEKRGTLINTDFNLLMMTPFYSGFLNTVNYDRRKFGGEFVNSYSFHLLSIDSNMENKGDKTIMAEIPGDSNFQRFNLFDLMGASSTAYGIITELVGLSGINPSYRVMDSEHKKVGTFDLVDGGILDNAGILPLLQKKVEKIVLFCNCKEKISVEEDDEKMAKNIATMIRQLFLGNIEMNREKYFHYFEYINDLQVFENLNNKDWKKLLNQLRYNIRNHDAAFVELTGLNVLENCEFSIPPYVLDTLTIIFLYQSEDWTNRRLDNHIRNLLQSPRFSNFPNYNTVFENSNWYEMELLQMDADEVNLLADLTYWSLEENPLISNHCKKIFS